MHFSPDLADDITSNERHATTPLDSSSFAAQSLSTMSPVPDLEAGTLDRLSHLAQFCSYTVGQPYDEMFDSGGVTRDHYAALCERLRTIDPEELRQRQSAADAGVPQPGDHVYGLR
jgi:hypothetical protein